MKKYTLFAAISFLGLLSISSCSKPDKKAELKKIREQIAELQKKEKQLSTEIGETKVDKSKLVEVLTIEKTAFTSNLVVEGTVDADESTIATARIPGNVISVNAQVGSTVSKGQILASLDNSSAAKGKLELEQQVAFITTVYEKQKRLWEKGIGTELQYLTVKNQKEALEKSLNTLNTNLDLYNVKSPISGTIESVDVKIGQATAPGIPIFKVVNMSSIKVVAQVAESYAKKVSKGDEVEIEFPDINKSVRATVSFASNFIDPLNRTFKVEVKIPGGSEIKPNMVAKLKIVDYSNKSALVVPSNCIQQNENESFVMVANKTGEKYTAAKRTIKKGKTNMDQSEIIDGLQVNDIVIVNGFQELTDGQVINPSNIK